MKPTHGMILAAGFGKRMRPLTLNIPKPLARVADKAMIDWVLEDFAHAKVGHVVINLHHLGPKIQDHLKDRSVTFVHEDPVLETGGGVQNALSHLGSGPFYVCNSDGFWTNGAKPALTRLAEFWDDAKMDALLMLHKPNAAFGYDGPGDFVLQKDGRLVRRTTHDPNASVFTGVQILHPRLFDHAPGGAYSLNVLYDRALKAGRLFGILHDGDWYHVGTIDALVQANALLKRHE